MERWEAVPSWQWQWFILMPSGSNHDVTWCNTSLWSGSLTICKGYDWFVSQFPFAAWDPSRRIKMQIAECYLGYDMMIYVYLIPNGVYNLQHFYFTVGIRDAIATAHHSGSWVNVERGAWHAWPSSRSSKRLVVVRKVEVSKLGPLWPRWRGSWGLKQKSGRAIAGSHLKFKSFV